MPDFGTVESSIREMGIKVSVIPFRGFSLKDLFRAAGAAYHIRKTAREMDADIVHTHLLKSAIVARLGLVCERRTVLVSQVAGVVHLDMPLLRLIERLTVRLDDMTLVSSTRFGPIYEELGARRVRVNHYGMDTSAFANKLANLRTNSHPGSGDGFTRVVMVAHMYPSNALAFRYVGVKGHEVLLDAARIALQRDGTLKFLIVGDVFAGGGDYRKSLEARASGIAHSVDFVGNSDNIPGILARADIAVNPSLSESASYTAMEASLAELPVVVSDVGGLTDTVLHGKTGFVVPPNDAESLAEAILAIASDSELSRKLGTAGRAHVDETFSDERIVDILESEYYALLTDRERTH